MKRFESLQINDRPVALALFRYEDHFYDAALRRYDFKSALHLYLKRKGYNTIIFFSIDKGLHSFEKEMLASFVNNDVQPEIRLTRVQQWQQKGRTSGHFGAQLQSQIETCNTSEKDNDVQQDKEGFWVAIRCNKRDGQIRRIQTNLLKKQNCVVVIEPSYSYPEFLDNQYERQTQYLGWLTGCLHDETVKNNGNHLILLANTAIDNGNDVPQNLLPSNHGTDKVKSSFWTDPFFINLFFDSSNGKYSLKKNSTCVLPCPTKDDIKNAFQHWRIVDKRQFKIQWNEIEEIFVQLSVCRGDQEEYLTKSLDDWERNFEDIEEVSLRALTKLGVHKIDNSRTIKFDKEKLANNLRVVKGQQDNMEIVVNAVNTWIRKKKKNRPLVFMFAGTSGTGKTFSAKNIQLSLEDDGYDFVRLDMSEYKSEGDNWKLLGSPTGYSGSDTDAPLFAARRKSEKLVILFDEIEKANPSIFTTIMSLMDEGFLADGKGENYDFRQSVIIFTTNLAMDRLLKTKQMLLASNVQISSIKFQKSTKQILKDNKVPNEVCGRIDWLLVYNALAPSDIVQIALEYIRRKAKDDYDLNINLVTESYLRQIAEQCAGSNEGARPVRKTVDTDIEPIFQNAHDFGLYSSDKLYDINDNMQLVESKSSDIKDQIVLDFKLEKTVKFDKEKLANDLMAVKGQQDNMEIIVDEIYAWIRDVEKDAPLVFMLAGTSGTGKTYTAEIIDKALGGYKLVKLPMNEYHNEADSWKLLGSSSGYIGSDKESPIFAARRETAKLIILFDEIEKAHPSLFTTIMTLMEKGEMGNGHGEVFDFKQSIIIFTTNHAMKELLRLKKESIHNNISPSSPEFQDSARGLLKEAGLKDEISGRLSWVFVYNTLDASTVAQIATEEIRKLGKKYKLEINSVSQVYLHSIAAQCADNNEGARPIKRMVTRDFKTKFQDALESGSFSPNKLYDINDSKKLVESSSSNTMD